MENVKTVLKRQNRVSTRPTRTRRLSQLRRGDRIPRYRETRKALKMKPRNLAQTDPKDSGIREEITELCMDIATMEGEIAGQGKAIMALTHLGNDQNKDSEQPITYIDTAKETVAPGRISPVQWREQQFVTDKKHTLTGKQIAARINKP
ncbi:hypothetical protein FQA39_LY19371 [Lamprigera yunnana]|nr:hypothetical protein FQA39_LY19371 [Lamprigera yunnana]